jgi:hypothetical protein
LEKRGHGTKKRRRGAPPWEWFASAA